MLRETGGYDIHLNWNIVSLNDLQSLGYGSAPRWRRWQLQRAILHESWDQSSR